MENLAWQALRCLQNALIVAHCTGARGVALKGRRRASSRCSLITTQCRFLGSCKLFHRTFLRCVLPGFRSTKAVGNQAATTKPGVQGYVKKRLAQYVQEFNTQLLRHLPGVSEQQLQHVARESLQALPAPQLAPPEPEQTDLQLVFLHDCE